MAPKKAKPKVKFKPIKKPSPIAVGFDLSLASLAGSAKMFDATLNKMCGPVWTMTRWEKDVPHDERLRQVSKAHDFIHEIMYELNGGFIPDSANLHIGVEELPPRVMNAQRYREQAEIIGAFVGGLRRYGFQNVHRINIKQWQSLVAADLEIKLNDLDKWKVKNWAREVYDAPKWKDLIRNGKLGLIPKPKSSVAMPEQPDDRYDATGIMDYTWELAHG